MSGKERDALPDHHLILGDCLGPTGLSTLPDKSVDHVICDPPYRRDLYLKMRTNLGHAGHGIRSDTGRPACPRKAHHGMVALANNAIGAIDDILEPVAREMVRLTKRWIVVFSDAETAHLWRAAFGDLYVRAGAWVKPDPMPQTTGDRPGAGFEMATIAHAAGRKRWNGGGTAAVWIYGTAKGMARPDHPCPKPLDLMESLISDFTDPGELVCDPFAGSGTTLVACKRLGRRAIGWERDATFWERAVRRLENTKQQYELLPRGPKPKQLKLGGA